MILSRQDEQLHIQRCMESEPMESAFTMPYTIERHPMSSRPPVQQPKRMTFDEAYEEAYIAACELDSPNSPGFDALRNRLLDELCIKHNIKD